MDTPNNADNLKDRTAKGLFWSIMGNGAQQLVVMLIGVLLARMLDRADYGLVGMLTVFSILASNLQESGFTAALSVKKEATHEDFNAVFWFSAFVSAALYVVLFFCAPLIARYNRVPELTLLGRVIFLGFFFTSLAISHVAWLVRNLRVKEKTTSQVTASLVSGFVGLGCAFAGCGVWSLVAMDLCYKLTHTLMVWYWTPWHPTWRIDLRPAWRMFGFGSRLLITNSLNTINGQLLQSLLGHFYKPNQVGDYSQANKWNSLGTSLLGGMINNVARPVMAKVVDDDVERQLRVVHKMLRFTAMLSFPAMLGLALIAPEFIVLTVGAKWTFCVPYLQVLCVGGAVFPVNEVFTNLMISRSRSDLYLYSTLSFLIVQLGLVWAFTGDGYADMLPLLVSVVALQPVWFFVLFMIARRLLALRLLAVLADVLPFALAAVAGLALGHFAAEGVGGHVAAGSTMGRIVLMLTKIVVTASAYCLIMWSARVAVFRECVDFALAKFRKKP